MAAPCPHVAKITSPPGPSTVVHKEECCLCFDSQDSTDGVFVCLTCFQAACPGRHADTHTSKTGHCVYVRITRTEKPEDMEPEKKITKLGIGIEGGASTGEKQYDIATEIVCTGCKLTAIDSSWGALPFVVDGVLAAETLSKREAAKAWALEPKPCEHTLCLEQKPTAVPEKGHAKCSECDLSENLWTCLVCGFLGCSRKQYAGAGGHVGGNEHALRHAKESGHGVAVKMGTITPAGDADLWCYICDDGCKDETLADHLRALGIDIETQEKTAQSMQEMELEGSLKLLTGPGADDKDGGTLTQVFGPGFTGLHNLGNSCYMASVLQCLFNVPAFCERYAAGHDAHVATCTNTKPDECFHCQIGKIGHGLLSGRYSHPEPAEGAPRLAHPNGLRPAMFKALIGNGHPEFSTGKQQDALEFLQHFLSVAQQKERINNYDPTTPFEFKSESRTQCTKCNGVRYTTSKEQACSFALPEVPPTVEGELPAIVPMMEAVNTLCSPESVADFACATCGAGQTATKKFSFKTFPRILTMVVRRETFEGWVPKKRDTRVDVPETLDIPDAWKGNGVQEGETEMPAGAADAAAAAVPEVNLESLSALMGMGFPEVRCRKALMATPSGNAEEASQWLFAHMDDADIDEPIVVAPPSGGAAAGGATADPEKLMQLTSMGFSDAKATLALRECDGNVERAVDWLFSHVDDPEPTAEALAGGGGGGAGSDPMDVTTTVGLEAAPRYELFSFVWHKGSSIQCGHYVAFIKKDGQWAQFNDAYVAQTTDCTHAVHNAYILFYRAKQ